MLQVVFNQKFGVYIKEEGKEKPFYLDLNLFNSQTQIDLYLTVLKDQITLSVQGLTFNDVIFRYVPGGSESIADGLMLEID
jgi:hypothetical protein